MYTPLDGAWGSLNDRPSQLKVLSEDLKEEIRTSWRHFRPASPPDQAPVQPSNPKTALVDCVSICADDDPDRYQIFDTQTIDGLIVDRGGQVWWASEPDPAALENSPPCGHSNFNIVGDDTTSLGKNDVDWWNYFNLVDGEQQEAGADVNCSAGYGKKKPSTSASASTCVVNGVNSPSTATDTPFWIVPKSASLPNNDW